MVCYWQTVECCNWPIGIKYSTKPCIKTRNLSLITLITPCPRDLNGETIVTLHSLERGCLRTTVTQPMIRFHYKWNTPSLGLQGHNYYFHFILQQRNTLQPECGFKEMSNVYLVVFVQAGPLHCSLKNHLSVDAPPFTTSLSKGKSGVFISTLTPLQLVILQGHNGQ